MTTGLVIGKFYPPHKGHKFLIETALSKVDQLTIVVCHRDDQTIHGRLRANWLRKIHPTANIIVVQDIMKDDDSKAWADYTKEFLGFVPDYVFSSEDYGEPYCKFLGAKHVLVDKARIQVPICATKIRNNPYENLQFLEPCVQEFYLGKSLPTWSRINRYHYYGEGIG